MRMVRIAFGALGWLAVVGFCCAAASAAGPVYDMKDVAMGTDGQLRGMVVDSTGAGIAGIPVALRLNNQEVASVTTDKGGGFAVEGLKGGIYKVAGPQDSGDFRVWMADAAPPTAAEKIVLKQDGPCPQPVSEPCPVVEEPPPPPPPAPTYRPVQTPRGLFGRPLLVGTAIAAAIAVPISVSGQKKPHSP